ncbi:MAG: Gfo/Idh/MocA family oxidoreductase [Kiritimatiellia bacterium]|jgi:predicted dehydrogenase|nr:Gfo/Idh/MocA family oxidoreductase [Kiritimatiellia bacterium]MDP6847969.1 Gfo/Idh/MocA family oxidoreductase [Kiritimatiellia bacterium]
MNRREFLKTAGVGAAAFAALPNIGITWADVPSRQGKIIKDRKINMACIGIGGKGSSDVRSVSGENIVALCDVDLGRGKGSFKSHPNAKQYKDFRKMLIELDDQIDAVTVSTPDHMHFPAAMMAVKMGKHVFVQKPMTHTVEEARVLTEAARKHKVATQMGIQGHSGDGIRRMREWMAVKAIGDVKELHIWTNRPIWPQGVKEPLPKAEIPANLDWNLWQGVAPEREYGRGYLPFNWRGWWDYGCGALGDIGCHALDCAFDVLKLGSPESVEAVSDQINDQTGPKWSIVTYQFGATKDRGPIKLVWYDGNKKPERPKDLEDNRKIPGGIGGQLWYGTEGTIMVSDVYCASSRIIPEAKMQDFIKNRMPEKTEKKSVGHVREWLDAIRGGAPAGANFDFAGPLSEMVLLGNLAVRTGKKVEWDAENLKCTNLPEANKFVRKDYRVY